MTGYPYISPVFGHQGDMPYCKKLSMNNISFWISREQDVLRNLHLFKGASATTMMTNSMCGLIHTMHTPYQSFWTIYAMMDLLTCQTSLMKARPNFNVSADVLAPNRARASAETLLL